MSEWKELKIDDLPVDILKEGVYEFDCLEDDCKYNALSLLLRQSKNGLNYHYRKRQPEKKQPIPEELAVQYADDLYSLGFSEDECNTLYNWFHDVAKKAFIAGCQSATIPPEAKS